MLKKIPVLLSILLLSTFFIQSASGADESRTLRLALLPIPDVLPVFVAQEKGYFSELSVVVEPLPVGSAVERDQLMQAGRIDGMINEIAGAANFNRDGGQVKIVAVARSPIGDSPLFRVLAAPGSGLETVKDLSGIPIGVSKNTIIEYITTRLLGSGGVAADAISYKSVPVLPERLQLLLSGQLKAVTLPDPLGASAIKSGAVEIISDTALSSMSASVITFSNDALTKKEAAVRDFMKAWDRASADLNADPESYRPLMLKNIRVPKNVAADFPIPPLPRKALPTREQWDDVMVWMVDKKLLKEPLVFEDSITGEFLPK
ncbi:MAG: ABC transporter substrate-binding protein [Desulforhopalus sp.]